jgi:hypothetical protein
MYGGSVCVNVCVCVCVCVCVFIPPLEANIEKNSPK